MSFVLPGDKTRIPPHTNVSKSSALVDPPLAIPSNFCFRVGGGTREWKSSEARAFDDTREHEAWNDIDEMQALCGFSTPGISTARPNNLTYSACSF